MAIYQPKSVQSATDAADAADPVAGLQAELAREQERLRKLWDAFKTQEDELARLRAGAAASTPAPALLSAPGPGSDSMQREVELLTADLRRAAEAQRRLEEEAQALREAARAQSEVARRAGTLEAELAEERERLAKLYAVYEEVDAERQRLEGRLKEWDAWFHGASPHIQELARSIQGAPRHS